MPVSTYRYRENPSQRKCPEMLRKSRGKEATENMSPRKAPQHTGVWRENKKVLAKQGLAGGEGGIRTRGRLLTYTRFPGVRLKPLIHLSEAVYSSSVYRWNVWHELLPGSSRRSRAATNRVNVAFAPHGCCAKRRGSRLLRPWRKA